MSTVSVKFIYRCKNCGAKYHAFRTTLKDYAEAYDLFIGRNQPFNMPLPRTDTHDCGLEGKILENGISELVGMQTTH